MEATTRHGADTIVVGVDGSASGRMALRWAAEEARRRKLHLHLVRVVDAGVGGLGLGGAEALAAEVAAAREVLAAETQDLGRELTVTSEVVCGAAGGALVEIARDAAMLVVGPRRHGALGSAILGSVSAFCTHHSRCPVVVVARSSTLV
jgi:nucleotide-binding universal stress UspA family protein